MKFRLVIDTNVLLVTISEFSKYHWLYQAIIQGKVDICVTTEILAEYAEIFHKKLGEETAIATLRTLMELQNVVLKNIHYKFQIIQADPDDNKFVDCAIAGNVDFLISNDKHFSVLKDLDFPKLNLVRLEEFEVIFKENLE